MSSIATTDQNLVLGARLGAVRSATGLSQHAFAVSLSLSPRAYANYERGEREMPVALFRALYKVHGIDPLWLLAGPEPNPVHAGERRLNASLLEEVIRVVEKVLRRTGKTLRPDKKARVIQVIYERCTVAGQVDIREARNLVSLAA